MSCTVRLLDTYFQLVLHIDVSYETPRSISGLFRNLSELEFQTSFIDAMLVRVVGRGRERVARWGSSSLEPRYCLFVEIMMVD